MIRDARAEDLSKMRGIEAAAGELFRHVGMAAVADDPPPALDALAVYQQDGRAWVATDAADDPIAYLLLDVVGRFAHIEQVTVHPRYARRGVGRLLIEEAARWAGARGLSGLTLTTFEEVPWNAPTTGASVSRRCPNPNGRKTSAKSCSPNASTVWRSGHVLL